jgi:hypothetical protein
MPPMERYLVGPWKGKAMFSSQRITRTRNGLTKSVRDLVFGVSPSTVALLYENPLLCLKIDREGGQNVVCEIFTTSNICALEVSQENIQNLTEDHSIRFRLVKIFDCRIRVSEFITVHVK